MDWDFEKLIMAFITIALFSFAFLEFVLFSAAQNGASSTIQQIPSINASINGLKTNLNNYQMNMNSSYGSFSNDQPTTQFGTLVYQSIGNIGRTIPSVTSATFNSIGGIIIYEFQNDPVTSIIISVLLGGMLVLIVLVIWRLVKIGL